MKIDQEFASLMREARAMRLRYIGGLLCSAWSAGFGFIRFGGHVLTRKIIGKASDISVDHREAASR